MNIIILVILVVIILIICNKCINKEDFHNTYINPYIQQPILFPIYSPYRRYYLLNDPSTYNTPISINYPYIPSMFAPYYSQYDILNR
jgi:hypothetical protein